jgi:hypothetical protein
MLAGAGVQFYGAARVRRPSRDTGSVTEVDGRYGRLRLRTVRQRMLSSGSRVIEAEQDIVHRSDASTAVVKTEDQSPIPPLYTNESYRSIKRSDSLSLSPTTRIAPTTTGLMGQTLNAVGSSSYVGVTRPIRDIIPFTFRAERQDFDSGPVHPGGTPTGDNVADDDCYGRGWARNGRSRLWNCYDQNSKSAAMP